MAGPLDGIRVIEVGQAYAGPLAGAILADMGADVIKVEKPDGGDDARGWGPPFVGGDSVMFHANNRNKRSVTLDLKQAEDVARLKSLARDADILIQNLRPGIVDELGIGPDALRAVNPRLIYCSIWAFGYQGPLKSAPGFDPLLQAFGGVMTLTGGPDDPPTFCAPAINDKATGMWCVIGALAALQQRHATGNGCVIDTSLFESAVAWVGNMLNSYRHTGNPPRRVRGASALLVPYQTFETADRPICIAAGYDRLFAKCAAVMGHPQWSEDQRFRTGPDRAANREDLLALMVPVLATRTRAEWLAALSAAGVPCSPVNSVPELSDHEQLAAVDLMRELPGSGLSVVGLPISFDRERPRPYRDSPKLGEHNAEVFGERRATDRGTERQ
jgi:formyl-CoA transferase